MRNENSACIKYIFLKNRNNNGVGRRKLGQLKQFIKDIGFEVTNKQFRDIKQILMGRGSIIVLNTEEAATEDKDKIDLSGVKSEEFLRMFYSTIRLFNSYPSRQKKYMIANLFEVTVNVIKRY